MAGGSNAAIGDSDESVFRGIQKVVERVRSDLPSSEVLLLSMIPNPRGINKTYDLVNHRLMKEYPATGLSENVRFVDVSAFFLHKNLSINKGLYGSDLIHPNAKGYELIMSALLPQFQKLPNLNLTFRSRVSVKPSYRSNINITSFLSQGSARSTNKVNYTSSLTQASGKSRLRTSRSAANYSKTASPLGKTNISAIVRKDKVA